MNLCACGNLRRASGGYHCAACHAAVQRRYRERSVRRCHDCRVELPATGFVRCAPCHARNNARPSKRRDGIAIETKGERAAVHTSAWLREKDREHGHSLRAGLIPRRNEARDVVPGPMDGGDGPVATRVSRAAVFVAREPGTVVML